MATVDWKAEGPKVPCHSPFGSVLREEEDGRALKAVECRVFGLVFSEGFFYSFVS